MQCQMCDDGKDIVSKCVDCDSTMCYECSTYHSKHKKIKTHVTKKIESTNTETSEKSILDEEVSQKRRDFLRLGIGALKSRITEIDGTIEMSKDEENSYNKFCTEGKEEIQAHAKRSKEIVCDIIDVLAKSNIQRIDEIQKKDIKSITNFQDELVIKEAVFTIYSKKHRRCSKFKSGWKAF
ncbi:unnamed protein product [Mytilus edulis]|uniref:B box-type domain-containing protein n=1 Tax=Mytilus edulis TaxID=6550 RepID=A0A8S3SCR4_MYTED|nr:unnamed protein product [Mytilus edulis]